MLAPFGRRLREKDADSRIGRFILAQNFHCPIRGTVIQNIPLPSRARFWARTEFNVSPINSARLKDGITTETIGVIVSKLSAMFVEIRSPRQNNARMGIIAVPLRSGCSKLSDPSTVDPPKDSAGRNLTSAEKIALFYLQDECLSDEIKDLPFRSIDRAKQVPGEKSCGQR